MTVPLLTILADDLTGAADAGGAFAVAGFRTVVALDDQPINDADVLVRSTASRGMTAADAADLNRRAAARLHELPPERRPWWVYKKIDSMLRGQPCVELLAVMAGLDERCAVAAPALPAQNRITIDARQRADGTPGADLLATFSCDGGTPVHALNLASVRSGADVVAAALRKIDRGIVIADAATDRDLAAIAQGALASDTRVIAGTAGLSRQLAVTFPPPARQLAAAPPADTGGPVLIVAASRNPATAAQIAVLEAAGVPVVRPSQAMLDDPEASVERAVAALACHLDAGTSAALSTVGLDPCEQGPRAVRRRLGAIVASLAEHSPVGGLVLTGGDVAAAVLDRLGATRILLGGEVQPAIPWGVLRSRLLWDVPVVTKAGSFGGTDALLRCLEHLAACRETRARS